MGNRGSTGEDQLNKKAPAGVTHTVFVKTGDKKGAGTDGNIFFSFADSNGEWSEEKLLDTSWHDDFEQGNTDMFHLTYPKLSKAQQIKIRRDDSKASDEWYLELVVVVEQRTGQYRSYFPVHRWIRANDKLVLSEFDSSLPSEDNNPEQRKKELEKKKEKFQFAQVIPDGPFQVANLPDDENFSNDYKWDIQGTKLKLFLQTKYIDLTTSNFESLEDFRKVYRGSLLPVPYGAENWQSDAEFGNQRLSGCCPTLLRLCSELPHCFPVTDELVKPFLEGKTLSDAMEKKKIYIVDLRYVTDIECATPQQLPGPLGLFYVQDGGDLVPIALQLMPEPGENNPIFVPSDPKYTWLAAKMWFNLADSSHHQSSTHLGFTHLMMEGVTVATHRELSPSHPIFKLLAPHFLYLLAINTLGLNKLISPGGWVDSVMNIGRTGMFNIIKRNWAEWDISQNGNLPADLKARGVDDVNALPNYHYRDDALLMWDAIYKYVADVVNGVYDSAQKLSNDTEIQTWVAEMAKVKVQGLPPSFTENSQLIDVVTSLIFTASVQHAAVNFCQYDEAGFPPNYPVILSGQMPKDKTALDEDYVVKSLPPKSVLLDTLIVAKLLSGRGTNSLGDFEVQYAYDPKSLDALKRFRKNLEEVGKIIEERNAKRVRKYPYLHPNEVPNAISI